MNAANKDPVLVFDFYNNAREIRRLCFADPLKIVVATSISEVRPALRTVEQAAKEGGYAAGYVSYEAAPAFESAFVVRKNTRMPLLWFAIFQKPVEYRVGNGSAGKSVGGFRVSDWQTSIGHASYCENVASIREAIARGDTYQINYTIRQHAKFEGDPFAFYERLRSAQRSRYCAYLDIGRYRILSVSPELFFTRTDNRIVMRPMKGTAPRGRWTEEDDCLEAQLAASAKDRAENVMIVDLIRSDAGRVAVTGSVRVPSLFDIEHYPTVFQMTSTVEATVTNETRLDEIFTALFPSGSVTGAPKISAMRLIANLEDSPREVYCGAIGLMNPGGDCTFNVAIRTVIIDSEKGTAEYGVGGGITWGSTAEGEYKEALVKANVLTRERAEFHLLETLKLEDGEYLLLERHLRRLADSARYFNIPLQTASIREALNEYASKYCGEVRRVRLLVSLEGYVSIQSERYVPLGSASLPVKLAKEPISRRNRMLYHKTTERKLYEVHLIERTKTFD